jgi:ankyrin repeat protein
MRELRVSCRAHPLRRILVAAPILGLIATCSAEAASDLRLITAVKNRNWNAAKSLVATHIDVNAREADGATALLWAAQWDHLATADLLVKAGADVNAANDFGVRPLYFAATNGSFEMASLLLNAGASVNMPLTTGETALMTAARTGNVRVVGALLDAGADVSAKEHDRGQTALLWALAEDHLEVAKLLLERGAELQTRTTNGFTPLLFATRYGNLQAVRLLMARGVDVNEAANDGTTPLVMAVVRGHVEIADTLLDAGANPNAAGQGFTALHWAAGTWESAFTRDYRAGEWLGLVGLSGDRRLHMMATLLEHGADPNARTTRNVTRFGSSAWRIYGGASPIGATPFFFAASVGDVEVMKFLLDHGANPHLTTQDNTTPLMAAAGLAVEESETRIPEARHLEAVHLLLDLGANVRETNKQGDTALHGAAFLGYDDIIRLLLENGADLNARNKEKQTPYRIALGIMVNNMFFQHPRTAALLQKLGGLE